MGRRNVDISPEEIVSYMLETGKSIRATANYFGIGKTTVHNIIKKYNGINKEKLDNVLSKNLEDSRFKGKQWVIMIMKS